MQADLRLNIPRGHERQGGGDIHQIVEDHSCSRSSPEGDPGQIIDFINGLFNGCNLKIVVYGINNSEVIQALNAARDRGVTLQVITDRSQWNATLDQERNFQVYVCGKEREDALRPARYIHSKFAVARCPDLLQVDQSIYSILLGSCNWTRGAVNNNFEYCIRVNNLPNQQNGLPNPAIQQLIRQMNMIRRYKRIGDPAAHSIPNLPTDPEPHFCTLYNIPARVRRPKRLPRVPSRTSPSEESSKKPRTAPSQNRGGNSAIAEPVQ